MCVLDSLSHFGSQDAKENKYYWPEIWEVYCDFSLTLKVKCPDSLNLLLKESAWLKSQNVIEGHPYQGGYWRWLLCNLGLRRNNHWFITSSQHSDPIKKVSQFPSSPTTGTPSASTEEGPQEPQDEGCVPDSAPWSGLCCSRRGSWAKCLRGTRDGLIWEEAMCVCWCVCVYLLWVCYVDP